MLDLKDDNYKWSIPVTYGQSPSPRESHSCVAYKTVDTNKLIIYGGMCKVRLGDVWVLNLDTFTWTKSITNGNQPLPRSLHSATVIRNRMLIFGGWGPLILDNEKYNLSCEKEWKCTNSLGSLNLETLTWETLGIDVFEESMPRARAGHSACQVNQRLYIWSGRDGYRKAWNSQVCCKDLWFMETEAPSAPGKVHLIKPTVNSLELTWTSVPTAESYILQIQKLEPSNRNKAALKPANSPNLPNEMNFDEKIKNEKENEQVPVQPVQLIAASNLQFNAKVSEDESSMSNEKYFSENSGHFIQPNQIPSLVLNEAANADAKIAQSFLNFANMNIANMANQTLLNLNPLTVNLTSGGVINLSLANLNPITLNSSNAHNSQPIQLTAQDFDCKNLIMNNIPVMRPLCKTVESIEGSFYLTFFTSDF